MTKTIDQLAIEERKAYFKKWRSENKDKVKSHNSTYWRKRALQKLVRQSCIAKKDGER